jgi:hypothetical protein
MGRPAFFIITDYAILLSVPASDVEYFEYSVLELMSNSFFYAEGYPPSTHPLTWRAIITF